MKAITLWQPWASLIASGLKTIETRSWKTEYRGLLAIHAAARIETDGRRKFPTIPVPTRCVLAICELTAVKKMNSDYVKRHMARPDGQGKYGNFAVGRYGWELRLLRSLEASPVRSVKGEMGLWNWNEDGLLESLMHTCQYPIERSELIHRG